MASASLLVASLLGVLGIAGAGAGYWYFEQYRDARLQDFEYLTDKIEEGERLDATPPDVSAGLLDFWRVTRHLQRGKRLANKGYVKWHRLDSTLSRPEWVKPEQDGSGVPKITVDGQPYYFPRDAMVTDGLTGAWTALHREGEADPINLRDPAYPGLEVDLVERTINLEAEDEPPGMLDDLFGGMDQTTLMYLGVGVLFLVYAVFRYMGGAV